MNPKESPSVPKMIQTILRDSGGSWQTWTQNDSNHPGRNPERDPLRMIQKKNPCEFQRWSNRPKKILRDPGKTWIKNGSNHPRRNPRKSWKCSKNIPKKNPWEFQRWSKRSCGILENFDQKWLSNHPGRNARKSWKRPAENESKCSMNIPEKESHKKGSRSIQERLEGSVKECGWVTGFGMCGIHGRCIRGQEAIGRRHGGVSMRRRKSGRRRRRRSSSTSSGHVKTRQIILRRHLRCHRPPSCCTYRYKFIG